MREFEVMVTETSTYVITVSAENEDQAINMVHKIAATDWKRIEDNFIDGHYELEIG